MIGSGHGICAAVLVGAVLIGMAPGVRAQEQPVFSIAATESCLAAAPDLDAKEDCIGLSATACTEATPGGSTTVGMVGCLAQEARYWDDRLNASYRLLRAQERTADSGKADFVPSLADTLLQMQRAWIPFRDATCDYERALWGGGSGTSIGGVSCMMQMTGEQTLYLEYQLNSR